MNNIQGLGGMQGMMGGFQPPSLTSDQKSTLQSILDKFDPENVSAADAKSIFEQLREAGIRPTREVKETIEAAGFDAEELRKLGMPEQGMRMGPPPVMALTSDQKSMVQSILEPYDPENITAVDAKSIFEQLRDAGIPPGEELKKTIEAAGFNVDELRKLGMPDQPNFQGFRGAQSSAMGINLTALQKLQTILEQYDLSNLSSDQQTSLYNQLNQSGLFRQGGIFNIGA